MSTASDIAWAVSTALQLQGYTVERVRLHGAMSQLSVTNTIQDASSLGQALGIAQGRLLSQPDPAFLPLITLMPGQGWGVITERQPNGLWSVLRPQGATIFPDAVLSGECLYLSAEQGIVQKSHQRFSDLMKQALRPYRSTIVEGVVATLIIGLLTLASSLFSMQVYDRVIPTNGTYTLVILASGVALVIVLELILKFARSRIMDNMVTGVDSRLSREVFQRLLSVRIDHLPGSVGSLASQVRGYEQVRNFYTASTLFTLADLPVAVMFLVLIALIGSVWVAVVPLVAAIVCLIIGFTARKQVDILAAKGAAVANRKTGMLVETVEGIETIKSGAGGWKFLSRWLDVTQQTVRNDLEMRHNSENLGYWAATIQQMSYALMIVVGAFEVISGNMTMGALIACSILGGRVLNPIMAIPNLMVQQAHAKAAMIGLESLYELKTDNHNVARPLTPAQLRGHYIFDQINFAYGEQAPSALRISRMEIRPGERVAIIGPIGSGKSTLLKLMSGLYHPQQGRVLLDGLEMTQISQQVLSEQVGYLQQDHRLFQGTLRENLLIGMPDPGDQVLYDALTRSGLIQLVSSHPRGLDLPISEGGKGLSGGQKQLVAFTRLVLNQPKILLLDEPTASMDDTQERRCLHLLAEQLNQGVTLVVVTHKPSLLPLVDRIVVVSGSTILMDGPRDVILAKLSQGVVTGAPQPGLPAQPAPAAPPAEPRPIARL